MSVSRTTAFCYSLEKAKSFFMTLLIGGILCIAFGVFFTVATQSWPGLTSVAVGLFFVFYGWNKVRRAKADRSAQLTISPEGVHVPDAAALLIDWPSIQKIVLHRPKSRQHAYMAIDVVDLIKFKPRGSNRFFPFFKKLLGGGQVTVNTDDLEGSLSDIKAAILRANSNVRIVDK